MSLLFSILCFAEFALVGAGAIACVTRRRFSLRMVLLSPAIGAAAVTIVTLPLSRLGASTAIYGRPLLIAVSVAAFVALLMRRCILPRRALLFLIPIAVVFAGLGLPLALLGRDWIAYGNEDMVTPLYIADWLTHHGMFSAPSLQDFAWNRDMASTAWAVMVFGNGNRTAAGCLMSMLAAGFGVTPLTVVMPVILAGYAGLVCATGALVTLRFRSAAAPLFATIAAALSCPGAYSVFNQNIEQIFGLTYLAGATTLLAGRSLYFTSRTERLRRAVLPAIAITGIALTYPELLAFLLLPWLVWSLGLLLRKRITALAWSATTLAIACLVVIFLNVSVLAPLVFFSYVTNQNPYGNYDYLAPLELANMWGFVGAGEFSAYGLLGGGIAAGALLLAGLLASVATYVRRWYLPGLTAGLMLCAVAYYYAAHIGYNVSKAIMYLEPFALALLVIAAFDLFQRFRKTTRVKFAYAPLVLLGAAVLGGANGTIYELLRSMNGFDDTTTSFVTIRASSREHLVSTLSQQLARSNAHWLVSDSPSVVLGEYEGELARGRSLLFPSRDVVKRFSTDLVYSGLLANSRELPAAEDLVSARKSLFTPATFGIRGVSSAASFLVDSRLPSSTLPSSAAVLASSGSQTVVNNTASYGRAPVTVVPSAGIHDHLVFVKSSFGGHDPEDPDSAIRSAVPDFSNAGSLRQWISKRLLLFEVLNPTRRFRLVFSFTVSPARLVDQQLPSPTLYGSTVAPMKATGKGAAQLYSAPLGARWIDGQAFVVLDAGRDPDSDFVTLARNISLVTDDEYARRKVPTTIEHFPSDLVHSGAEFSGAYEDGWIAGTTQFELRSTAADPTLIVQGQRPASGRTSVLTLSVDGRTRLKTGLAPGNVMLSIPLKVSAGIHRIEISGLPLITFPSPDGRSLSLRISRVAFEAAP